MNEIEKMITAINGLVNDFEPMSSEKKVALLVLIDNLREKIATL